MRTTVRLILRCPGYSDCVCGVQDGEGESLSEIRRREAIGWRSLFLGSLLMTAPAFMIALPLSNIPLTAELLDIRLWRAVNVKNLLLFSLSTPVQFHFGAGFYDSAYKSLKYGATTMDVLIALGTTAAYSSSIIFIALACYSGMTRVMHSMQSSISRLPSPCDSKVMGCCCGIIETVLSKSYTLMRNIY